MKTEPVLTLNNNVPEALVVQELEIDQRINEIPSALITLIPQSDTSSGLSPQILAELAHGRPGSTLRITEGKNTLFSGQVIGQHVAQQGKEVRIVLTARHALQNLLPLPRCRLFRQQNDEQILHQLFNEAGVGLRINTAAQLTTVHEQLLQFRTTDWAFLRSRLAATNCWLVPDAASNAATISAVSMTTHPAEAINRQEKSNGEDLYALTLEFDNRFTLSEVELGGWDVAHQTLNRTQHASQTTLGSGALQPDALVTPRRRILQQYYSYQPENQLAQSLLNHAQINGVRGSLTLQGTTRFRCGESLQLAQFGHGLDGAAVITGVRHRHEKEEGWRTQLTLGMLPELTSSLPPIKELLIAVVAPFQPDPAKLDRIPLIIPALNLPETVLFARLGKPWASDASGFCFYPEPGDEVIIGFFEQDPRYPVILGAMHNPRNRAPFGPDKANAVQALVVSHQGKSERLEFNTQKATVALTAGETQLTLANSGNATLIADQNIRIAGAKIDLSHKGS